MVLASNSRNPTDFGKSKMMKDAVERVEKIQFDIDSKKKDNENFEDQLKILILISAKLETEISHMTEEKNRLSSNIKKEEYRIEEFWVQDPKQTRKKFLDACKNLATFSGMKLYLFSATVFVLHCVNFLLIIILILILMIELL